LQDCRIILILAAGKTLTAGGAMKFESTVLDVRFITDSVFYLRFERGDFEFKAGQYIVVSLPGSTESREYSVASGERDPWIEILVKKIDEEGSFTTKLSDLKPGDLAMIDGPFGFFVLKEEEIESGEYVFIATGTGISPFESFVRSYPGIDYHLFHGVRIYEENFGKDYFPLIRRTICTSRDLKGNYTGRVTECIREEAIDPAKIYYLCGNSKMIEEMAEILEHEGVPPRNIRSEVFF
jgi:ferredoxin-NADP reductase